MDTILRLLQTPAGTILFFAGVIILFFAFFEVSKGTVKMRRKPKEGTIPAIIGVTLIIVGLILNNSQTAALGEPTPTPVLVNLTESPVVTPTAIPHKETAASTNTPIMPTETATPVPIRTFAESCIDGRVWNAASTNSDALATVNTRNNCLSLGSLGITAQNGTLHFFQKDARTHTVGGIYTTIGNQSVIEFKVFVNSLYLVFEGNPVYLTFSVAPRDNPMTRQGSGRFKLQVNEIGEDPLVLFTLADVTESNGVEMGTQHYLYGRTYTIRLELKEVFMDVYINGIDTRQSITIPSGENVLYIGYSVPMQAGVDVEIQEIKIDDVKK